MTRDDRSTAAPWWVAPDLSRARLSRSPGFAAAGRPTIRSAGNESNRGRYQRKLNQRRVKVQHGHGPILPQIVAKRW
jgi:hypothetical protein